MVKHCPLPALLLFYHIRAMRKTGVYKNAGPVANKKTAAALQFFYHYFLSLILAALPDRPRR
jgi:hypothetical protein